MDLNLKTVDLEMFARFGVTQAWLAQAGVWRATDVEARREFLITRPGDMSGLVFPYVDPVSGCRATARIRRDHPEIDTDGKPAKYICPHGDNRHLYFPPGSGPLLGDGGVPVVLVESEKAALALTALATGWDGNSFPSLREAAGDGTARLESRRTRAGSTRKHAALCRTWSASTG